MTTLTLILPIFLLLSHTLPLPFPSPPSTTSNPPLTSPVLLIPPHTRPNASVLAAYLDPASLATARLPSISDHPYPPAQDYQLEITAIPNSRYLPLAPTLTLIAKFVVKLSTLYGGPLTRAEREVDAEGGMEVVLEPPLGSGVAEISLQTTELLMWALFGTFEEKQVAYPCRLRILDMGEGEGGREVARGNLTVIAGKEV